MEKIRDQGYIVISSAQPGDFHVREGNDMFSESNSKAVVGGDGVNQPLENIHTQTDTYNSMHSNAPLKLIDLANSGTSSPDMDSCIGSEVTSPHVTSAEIDQIEESVGIDNEEFASDHGIHSPGIYYQPEQSDSSDEEDLKDTYEYLDESQNFVDDVNHDSNKSFDGHEDQECIEKENESDENESDENDANNENEIMEDKHTYEVENGASVLDSCCESRIMLFLGHMHVIFRSW